MRRIKNNDLFLLLRDYAKRKVREDLEFIYGKKLNAVIEKEPWIFSVK